MSDTEKLAQAIEKLAEAMKELAAKMPQASIAGGCSVYHYNVPYPHYPTTSWLGRDAGGGGSWGGNFS